MSRPFTLLDVFAERRLAGNQLAVVHDADGLDEQTMLAFAKETKLSETTFVQTATEPGADYRNRIWTVTSEIPFAGHPSLGTAVAESIRRGEESVTYTQQTRVGLQRVSVERHGDTARASVLQEPAEFGEEIDPAVAMAALGLGPADAHPSLTPQKVSTGLMAVMIPVADRDRLAAARPDFEASRRIDERPEINLYAFALDDGTAHARCFGADLEGIEDPATGSAAGPLIAYLHRRLGLEEAQIRQGEQMGRPSLLEARMEDGRPRVGGGVQVVARGELLI